MVNSIESRLGSEVESKKRTKPEDVVRVYDILFQVCYVTFFFIFFIFFLLVGYDIYFSARLKSLC